jgi:DNA-directed RNA polymerase subunit K
MVELKLDKNKLTKYEKARIIGARSLQISMGAPILVKMTPKKLEELHYDPLEIAKLEFEEGIIPISIKRMEEAD